MGQVPSSFPGFFYWLVINKMKGYSWFQPLIKRHGSASPAEPYNEAPSPLADGGGERGRGKSWGAVYSGDVIKLMAKDTAGKKNSFASNHDVNTN